MNANDTPEPTTYGDRETILEENSSLLAAFLFPPVEPSSDPETVIVAEDESSLRALIRMTLASKGYNVLVANGGVDALRICEQYEGTIHLLITDVVMPGMSGPALADRLTTSRPELKVLYLSGHDGHALARYGIEEDQVDFLQKPFSMASMGAKIRVVLDAL